jgi:hypothetical protein
MSRPDERQPISAVGGACVAQPARGAVTLTHFPEAIMAHRFVAAGTIALLVLLGAADAREAGAKTASDEAAPPAGVSRFLMGTRLGYITCSGKYRSYLEKLDLYTLVNQGQSNPRMSQPSNEDSSACVHETLLKGRSLYNDASRHAIAPAAKTALKEYMTAWEASLSTLNAKQPEKVREFDVRQKKQEARLDELQARLETAAR